MYVKFAFWILNMAYQFKFETLHSLSTPMMLFPRAMWIGNILPRSMIERYVLSVEVFLLTISWLLLVVIGEYFWWGLKCCKVSIQSLCIFVVTYLIYANSVQCWPCRQELVSIMSPHMERHDQTILFWSFNEPHHTTRGIGHMFVVFILGVNAPEVLNALIDTRCLKLESCPNKISRIVIMGMVDLFLWKIRRV